MRALCGEPLHDPVKPGGKVDGALLDKMAEMGWPKEQIERVRARLPQQRKAEANIVEVEPELWNAFCVFRLVQQTQWRCQTLETAAGFVTQSQSLDYAAVAAVAKDLGLSGCDAFWEQIGAMELEALAIRRGREVRASRRR